MTTIKPGSVVVGVDGSGASDDAVTWAVGYATLVGRPLVITSAAGSLEPTDWPTRRIEARHEGRIRARRATDHALALAQRTAPGLDVSAVTLPGDAADELVALSSQASMLALATRGNGPVTSLVLGSVSVLAASRARCPVAVVRPQVAGRAGVVVGVSGDGSDTAAIEFAAALADAEGCPLDAVHAFGQNAGEHARVLEESLAGLGEKYPDLLINRHLPDADPVAALVTWSRQRDLVVIGSRGRTSKIGLVGSVGRALVEHADSTVVLVRS